MIQLPLPPTGSTANVDKIQDKNHPEISYIGIATQMGDGSWRCLANIGDMLCIVEVQIKTSKL
jgi:hypothetical protein